VEGGWPPSPDVQHGTAVAGIAAAITGNGKGIAGIACGAQILPVSLGSFPTAAGLAAGLRWASQNGARVVNLSFSTVPTDCANKALQDVGGHLVLCAATGNDGSPQAGVTFPASHASVIGVGAANSGNLPVVNQRCFDPQGRASSPWSSQYGLGLSTLAPGLNCWTTYPLTPTQKTGYGTACGTSLASPHVAGLAALLWSLKPSLTNVEVRRLIEANCQRVGSYTYIKMPGYPNGNWCAEAGYGLVDCYAAFKAATSSPPPS
jgi:subtilisin family serine protease